MENAFSTSEKYYFCQTPTGACMQAAKLLWSIIYGRVFSWKFLFFRFYQQCSLSERREMWKSWFLVCSILQQVMLRRFVCAYQLKSSSPRLRNFCLRLQMENEQIAFTSRDEWMLSSSDLWFIIGKLFFLGMFTHLDWWFKVFLKLP